TSPTGTTVTITTGNGAAFANVFNGTTWEDRAGTAPVTDATYAANVVRTSLVPEEAMSAFTGQDPNGQWTLTVLDTTTGQAGTLSSWSLVLVTGSTWNLMQTLTAAPAGVLPGGTVTYTAAVASTGPGDAQGPLTFTLPLPAAALFTSIVSPAGWTCVTPAVGLSGTITCTRPGTLAVGATQTFTVATTVAPATPVLTQVTATATVQSGAGELNISDNAATATSLVVQPTAVDTDGDSLSNTWETTFGLDPASPGGANGPFGDPDGDGLTNAQELAAGTHPRGFHTRYFAEGATSTFFDVRFALLNTAAESAHTLLRFLPATGPAVGHTLLIGPATRATVTPKTLQGMAVAEFATVVESDQPVIADRTLSWDGQGYGSHAESSVAAPATQWYLAEGATHSGFQLFYLLQNANATTATVTVEYLLPSGGPVTRAYVVAGNSRQTVWVNTDPALSSTDVSATITSDLPIIVERAMYLNRAGQTFAAGHGSAGVTAPSTTWFLAEGATGPFFDLFVLIANPTQTAATITATFLRPDGSTVVRTYPVAAKSRFNIWVDEEGPELANTAVSTTIASDVPVLVERAMWWPGNGNTWHEAHNSFGATSTGVTWALAEGEQGGPTGVETYVLVANTSAFAGQVRVTLFKEDGTTLVKTLPVAANSRLNVPIGAAEAAGGFGPTNVNGRRFGCVVESLVPAGGTDPAQIVVERAMYSNAGGVVWAAG
ncbi:MAG: proprotein convertase P-domain-containing protein, partial [Acidobacteria bacterium]|nr:proprotein convertase P-domain-containing protein [Acidobacteriota bacterium]